MVTYSKFLVGEGILVLTLQGNVSGEQILEALQRLWADPSYRSSYHHLWDCRGVRQLDIDWPIMKSLVAALTSNSALETEPLGKITVLAPRFVDYAFARSLLAQIRTCKRAHRVFRHAGEAETWLGITIPHTIPI